MFFFRTAPPDNITVLEDMWAVALVTPIGRSGPLVHVWFSKSHIHVFFEGCWKYKFLSSSFDIVNPKVESAKSNDYSLPEVWKCHVRTSDYEKMAIIYETCCCICTFSTKMCLRVAGFKTLVGFDIVPVVLVGMVKKCLLHFKLLFSGLRNNRIYDIVKPPIFMGIVLQYQYQ